MKHAMPMSGHEVTSMPKRRTRKMHPIDRIDFHKIADGTLIATKHFKNDGPGPWIESKEYAMDDVAAAAALLTQVF